MSLVSTHLRRHRARLTITYSLTVVENLFELLYPFAIGLTVNGLLDDSWSGVAVLVAITLAHIAGFLEDRIPGSPHGTGFLRLARRLNERLRADPALADRAVVSRWHEISPEDIRRIAGELAGELWP